MKPSIQKCLQALRAGEPVLLTMRDNAGTTRGSLILAAERATPAGVNLLALEGRGVVCVGIDATTAQRLELSPMVPTAGASATMGHPVSTISIDAREGTTTGISAGDRAVTLRLLASEQSTSDDFIRPGHLFPYVAHDHGVLGRHETPEAVVDLVRLAGLKPAGAFCGVLDRSGKVADAEYLEELASRMELPTVSMEELVEHQLLHGQYLQRTEKAPLDSEYGDVEIEPVYDTVHDEIHHVVTKEPANGKVGTVYVHQACVKGDVFRAKHCKRRKNLEAALEKVAQDGGIVVYLGSRTPKARGLSIAAQLIAGSGLTTVQFIGSDDAAELSTLLEQVGVATVDSAAAGAAKEAIATGQ